MNALRPSWVLMALALRAAPAAHALDLLQAWQGAEQHAPAAAAARAERDAGAARGEQARALWRPSVLLEGGAGYASSDSEMKGASFTAPGMGTVNGVDFRTSISSGTATRAAVLLRQPIYNPALDAQSRALEVAAGAAQTQWLDARQALMLRTAQGYFNAAVAAERVRLLARQQQAVNNALTEAQDRYRIGDQPVTGVHEAAARAASLRAERAEAGTQAELSRVTLADLTGLDEARAAPLSLPGDGADARSDEPQGSLGNWLAKAAANNPALQLARAQVQRAEAEALSTRGAFAPTVDVVAQIARDSVNSRGDYASGASQTATNKTLGVRITIPLYTGGMRSAQDTERQALIEHARAEFEAARQQVAEQTHGAWLEVTTGQRRIEALTASLQASLARLDATRTGLDAGDRTTQDLLNAENDAGAAELALTAARAALLTARLRLAALAGELDDTALQQVNAWLTEPAARRPED